MMEVYVSNLNCVVTMPTIPWNPTYKERMVPELKPCNSP